jgi:hypothetical protein
MIFSGDIELRRQGPACASATFPDVRLPNINFPWVAITRG